MPQNNTLQPKPVTNKGAKALILLHFIESGNPTSWQSSKTAAPTLKDHLVWDGLLCFVPVFHFLCLKSYFTQNQAASLRFIPTIFYRPL